MQRKHLFYSLIPPIVVVLVLAGYWGWSQYFDNSPERIAERYYIAAMTADTAGGQTPRETLNLFIAALKAEDIKTASEYFLFDENYSREKWLKAFEQIQAQGVLELMTKDIETARPAEGATKDTAVFDILAQDGTISTSIILRFNRYAKIWKIESL